MTHWNHEVTKGSRIDRFYMADTALNKCSSVGYAPFEYGDHGMRTLIIGDNTPPVIKLPQLSEDDLKIPEVAQCVKDLWEAGWPTLEPLSGEEFYASFAALKEHILKTGSKTQKRVIRAREKWGRELKNTVECLLRPMQAKSRK